MTTPERAFQAYEQAHPVSTRLEMLSAAMNGGPAAMEQQRQVLAARQMQPLMLAQQLAQFGGIQGLYRQLGDAGRTDLQNLLLVDPASALKAVTQLITPTLTPQGQTLQAPGLGGQGSPAVSMTAPLLNPPAPGAVASTQTPASFTPTGVAPQLTTTGINQKAGFIAPPMPGQPAMAPVIGLNGQSTGQSLPAPPGQTNSVPTSQEGPVAGRPMTAEEMAPYHQPPGTVGSWKADGTPDFTPPDITAGDFYKLGETYSGSAQHLDAVSRAQSLSAVGSIISRLPPGALQSQAALNTYLTSLTSKENPVRPATTEELLKRMGLPDAAYQQITGLGPAGQTPTPTNIRDLYRAAYLEAAPRVQADEKLLGPIDDAAAKHPYYDASRYHQMHPQLPDVPAFARDALPNLHARTPGLTVWGAKGPAKWNGQKWTLIGQ